MGSTFNSSSSAIKGYELLSQGGEMGELIRSHDWAATPIGPIEAWPQSLLTTLSILLHSQFPMFLWWGNDLIQFYNDAFRPSLGMDGRHPKALGQKAVECWPEIWSVIKPMIDQVMSGDQPVWSEDQLIPIFRNGKMEDVYWTFSYSAVKVEDGSIGGVLVVCSETTNKVLNLKKLQETEDQLRFAIEATELGTFDFNPATNTFKSNNRLKDWFGLPANAEVDLSVAIAAVAEPDKQRVLEAIHTALQYAFGGFYNIEYRIIHPITKKERIVKAKGRVWFNEAKIAYRFNGTLQDITEQVSATTKMLEAEAVSKTTMERLQLALEAGKLGSYEMILSSGEIHCTPQCKLNFGIPENETLNMEKLHSIIIPEDKVRVQQKRDEAIAHHEPYHIEYRISLPNGDIRWVLVSGKVIYDELDQPLKIIGVTKDISDQKSFNIELEKKVRERTHELQQSTDDLQQFSQVTRQDLKEPVRKVKTYTTRLKEEFASVLSEKGMAYLDKVESASNRMFSMIENVLHYSSSSISERLAEQVDLNTIIDNIESDIELLIQQKNGSLEKSKLPVIEGSNVLVYQLFYNLINNSFKFSKKDLKAVVSISSSIVKRDAAEFVKITIKDNGIGFDKKQIPKLFTAFSRLHPADKYEGSGLGLALCKRIVEQHGGSIVADGKENEGAVFTVLLPIKQTKPTN
jgi:PAS domain S-box-containing protein